MEATKIPRNKDWHNPLDNSEQKTENEARDIAQTFTAWDEMRAEREYYETLMKRDELLSKNKVKAAMLDAKGVMQIEDLDTKLIIAPPSEFESLRIRVLMKLNDATKTPPDELRRRMAEFETDSIFDLSGKMANFLLDKKRKEHVWTTYKV